MMAWRGGHLARHRTESMLFEQGVPFRYDWEAVLTPVIDAWPRPDVDASALTGYGAATGSPGRSRSSAAWSGRSPTRAW